MARLVGPDEGSRLVYGIRADNALSTGGGMTATVYSDAAGTVLADILTYPGGATVPGSVLTVESGSLLPLFQFPDGVDTVYVSANGGPVSPVYARTDDRLDALASRVTGVESGKVSLSLVDAKGDLIVGDGVDTVTRLPVGADRRVLTADSSQPAGTQWVDPLGLECVLTNINGSLGTGSNAWPVANDARYARVIGSGTISKIGFEVMTQSGNICVAVYSKTGVGRAARPGARIATSGAIACPTVGYVEVALGGSVAVSDGDYLAMSCDNVTAAFRGLSGGVNALAAPCSYEQVTAHPLPTNATPVASASRIPLLIGT